MNEPKRHHYIPEFYLKRWAGIDGRICQWSKPHKRLVPRRVYPSQTCYVDRLYEIRGLPADLSQQVERSFFQPIDSLAADILLEYERTGQQPKWTDHRRSAWTRFLLSLQLRRPDDISNFRRLWEIDFYKVEASLEAEYAATRMENEPTTFKHYLEGLPLGEKEASLFETYLSLMNSSSLGQGINNMHWAFINVETELRHLFTSDAPVIKTSPLAAPDGHIVLPVGPRRLFVASMQKNVLDNIASAKAKILIEACNGLTVEAAKSFAFSLDDSPRRYFENRFGRSGELRVSEMVLRSRLEGEGVPFV